VAMVVKAKKKAKAKAKAGDGGKKAGLLAGKIKEWLPPSLDLSGFSKAEEDEGPPEEVTNRPAPGAAGDDDSDDAPEEVSTRRGDAATNAAEVPVAKKRGRRKVEEEEEAPEVAGVGGYVWEDPENRRLLEMMREKDVARRKRKTGPDRVVKHGFTLVRADHSFAGDPEGSSAASFLAKELFEKRKRKRMTKDRNDRNVLGGARSGAHRS